jgi:hypothetical protein
MARSRRDRQGFDRPQPADTPAFYLQKSASQQIREIFYGRAESLHAAVREFAPSMGQLHDI